MQSITVSTRLRSADRPATCGAARGHRDRGVELDHRFDRGSGQCDALAGDGDDQQKLVHLPLPALADFSAISSPARS